MQSNERLIIKNFAGIKNIDIDLKRFTVFIGEQASGKSITSKVYFFLKSVFFNNFQKAIIDNEKLGIDHILDSVQDDFGQFFPFYMWRDDTFVLEWRKDDVWIKIAHRKQAKNIKVTYSPLLKDIYGKILERVNIEEEKNQGKRASGGFIFWDRWSVFFNVLRDYREQIGFETVTYIPAGRSFFSTIQKTVFTLLAENKGIDPFLKEFGKFYEQIRDVVQHANIDYTQDRGKKIESVLKGQYAIDGRDYWLICKNKKIRVADTSSGQQEALPLLLGLHALYRHIPSSVVIEEPEAHLYPLAQQTIVNLIYDLIGRDLIGRKIKLNRKCLLTTHSPYILACVNNEIIKDENKRKNDVAAYHLHDGTATSIFNKGTGLIDATDFDELSFTIANDSNKEE